MLDSVVSQTLKEIEILCINDGSTDHSRAVILQYQKKDPRIFLLEQTKKNAGAARNLGLAHARGTYVVFWDADDRFHKRALELMYWKMERTRADLCVCGANEFTDQGKIYETYGYLKDAMLPKNDPFHKFDLGNDLFRFTTNVPWNKMFRRSFLMQKELIFQEIQQTNDTAFVMLSLFLANRITYVKRTLIFYRINNPDSLTGLASETIFCPYESYRYTLVHLKKEPDFFAVEKGFQNKAVRGMIRALNTQTSFAAYERLYDFLKKEGLEKLGVLGLTKEDVEEPWIYENLQRFQMLSAEEFLLETSNDTRKKNQQLTASLRKIHKKLAVPLWIRQQVKKLYEKRRRKR
jgi:glycosyltransferase involved in cell wall biosynthesis